MSWIIKFVNRIAKPNVPKPIYGRWGMEYKPNQVDARIDLANEDHCGPCGDIQEIIGVRKQFIDPKFDKKR